VTTATVAAQPDLVRRAWARLRWTGWVAVAAGSAVIFAAVGFLLPVFVPAEDHEAVALLNAPMVLAALAAGGALLNRFFGRYARSTLAWLVEGRVPTPREHTRTLQLALHSAKAIAAVWAAFGAAIVLVNTLAQSWEAAVIVGATAWLGAETTCALFYLAAERELRPITAAALAVRGPSGVVAPGVRVRLFAAWLLGTGVPLLGIAAVAGLASADPTADGGAVAAAVLFLAGVGSVTGLLATLFAAKAIAHPVRAVRTGLARIAEGELDTAVAVDDASEVGLLQAGFNRMADGLRERERIRDLFGRQVGEEVARAALRNGTRLGGEERLVGALYVDLLGSTSMALAMPPTEVVRVLNRFFRVVVEAVEAEGGFVNKFEGDAALCVFGAPVPREDPAGDAMRCARALAAGLAREVPEVDFGIGISAGIAVAGNVGAERRFEYTVIGDPVNEAARLAELAKERPDRVLASEAALSRAEPGESAAWSLTESALLRGRSAATGVARPLG